MNSEYDVIMASVYGWQTCRTTGFATRNGQLLRALLAYRSLGRILFINPYYFPKSPLTLLRNTALNLCTPPWLDPRLGILQPALDARLRILNPLNLRAGRGTPATYHSWLHTRASRLLTRGNRQITWLYNAAEAGLYDQFPGSIKVFDTEDNWLEIARSPVVHETGPWYCPEKLLAGYRRIARDDVWIISNGGPMTSFFLELGADESRVLEVPNGVDPELFDPVAVAAAGPPADLGSLPRPIAGYVGRFEDRVDTALLKFLTEQNPDVSFVMIGAIENIDWFEAPNLHWLGPRAYDQVPRYINHFDTGILPHLRNGITRYNSPMKIYEYLAMGRSVVATSADGCEDVAQHCHIAGDRHDFNRMLRLAVGRDNQAVSGQIRQMCSWGNRAAEIMGRLGILTDDR